MSTRAYYTCLFVVGFFGTLVVLFLIPVTRQSSIIEHVWRAL